VLEDGTGFLTPDDVEEFDVAIDEYCNGLSLLSLLSLRLDHRVFVTLSRAVVSLSSKWERDCCSACEAS
jgi:hypothetical protein